MLSQALLLQAKLIKNNGKAIGIKTVEYSFISSKPSFSIAGSAWGKYSRYLPSVSCSSNFSFCTGIRFKPKETYEDINSSKLVHGNADKQLGAAMLAPLQGIPAASAH